MDDNDDDTPGVINISQRDNVACLWNRKLTTTVLNSKLLTETVTHYLQNVAVQSLSVLSLPLSLAPSRRVVGTAVTRDKHGTAAAAAGQIVRLLSMR